MKRLSLLIAVWAFVTCAAFAEPPALPTLPQPPQPKEPKDAPPEPKKDVADPTSPGPLFEKILNPRAPQAPGAAAAFRMPPVAIRGRIISKDRAPSALLELDGRLYLVTKNSVLGGGNNVTLRIVELNASEVRIEVAPFNEVVVLR